MKFNIELENDITINGVQQYGWCYSTRSTRRIKGDLFEIIEVLKSNKNLREFNIDLDFSPNGSLLGTTISIPLEQILYIKNEDEEILYSKYGDNSL